jgi:hypothetical protein
MADILCEGFSIQKGNGYLEVVFLSNFEQIDHIQFEKKISSSLTSFFIIINCDRLTFIPKDWLKIFLKIHLNLKKYRKSLKLINLSPSLMDYF